MKGLLRRLHDKALVGLVTQFHEVVGRQQLVNTQTGHHSVTSGLRQARNFWPSVQIRSESVESVLGGVRVRVRVRDGVTVMVISWTLWHRGGKPNVCPKMPTL